MSLDNSHRSSRARLGTGRPCGLSNARTSRRRVRVRQLLVAMMFFMAVPGVSAVEVMRHPALLADRRSCECASCSRGKPCCCLPDNPPTRFEEQPPDPATQPSRRGARACVGAIPCGGDEPSGIVSSRHSPFSKPTSGS